MPIVKDYENFLLRVGVITKPFPRGAVNAVSTGLVNVSATLKKLKVHPSEFFAYLEEINPAGDYTAYAKPYSLNAFVRRFLAADKQGVDSGGFESIDDLLGRG